MSVSATDHALADADVEDGSGIVDNASKRLPSDLLPSDRWQSEIGLVDIQPRPEGHANNRSESTTRSTLAEPTANSDQAAGTADTGPSQPLPKIRTELILEPVQFNKRGQPSWVLQDPVKGKYYKLGWLEFELLSRWHCNNVDELIAQTNAQTTLRVNNSHVESLLNLLKNNELIKSETNEDIRDLEVKARSAKPSALKSAFSFTMFYRKPLLNPDAFLAAVDRLIAPAYSMKKALLVLWVNLAAIALNGVAAHWFEFKNTFSQFMTIEGFALFALVLIMTNTLHEIGHGLVAKHYGCRVTEMGMALIFMLPVCYCDTSDAWRLGDKRKRLYINAGGLLMELLLATVACLLWLMLPDGIPRTLMFFLAVTSLATTLFINLNPFMKFDGYYLLADALGVDNMQARSFANCRWQLQRWVTGCHTQKPYRIPESSHKVLTIYALSTWAYRLILYFTICWMVYEFWFKALGLILMTGVFIKMIAMPVLKESASYGSTIAKTGVNRRSVSSGVIIFLLLAALLVPLPRKVSAPAVLGSGHAEKVFATRQAKVGAIYIAEGDELKAGQMLLSLVDPELEYSRNKLVKEIETLKQRKQMETQWMSKDISTQVSAFDIKARESALAQVSRQISALQLRATENSIVTALPDWLKPGVWVNTNTVLAELASSNTVEVRAYVPSKKSDLLHGQEAVFYSNTDGRKIQLNTRVIGESNIEVLDDRALAVRNGGEIPVAVSRDGELNPLQGWVLALLTPVSNELKLSSERPGYVMFPAKAKSLMASAFERLYGVVIRESGF